MSRRCGVSRYVGLAALMLGGAAALVLALSAFLSVYFARKIVTPPRRPVQDVRILAADDHEVTLSATPDALTPGSYSLWFSSESGHARIGRIISETPGSVTRELLAVDFGELSSAREGRISGWFYLSPEELGLPWSDVEVETDLGPAPAWLIPGSSDNRTWVIQVHGRAVRRQEALRAVPVFHRSGYTSLIISYRNDGDAPTSPDHRYSLGDTEWRDVEAAMAFALRNGAENVILMGWSMGGATVLQTLTRSSLAPSVRGLVLDSPVIDWVTTLQYQGTQNRLPPVVRSGALLLLSRRWGGGVTGQAQPVDLRRLDLVAGASELDVPILLLHSESDGFVPVTASDALALERPDIVTYERFTGARHTKLWNFDRERWESAITRWLDALESSTVRTGS